MGKRYPYMVHTMTDETYAANCALQMQQEQRAKESDQKMGQNEKKAVPEEDEKNIAKSRENIRKRDEMFWIALFSRISWMLGAVAGGVIGQSIPVELKGIDFCMTALFVTIFVDQWRSAKSHIPALLGLGCGVVLLLLVGPDYFLLPTLILVSGILLLIRGTMNSQLLKICPRVVAKSQDIPVVSTTFRRIKKSIVKVIHRKDNVVHILNLHPKTTFTFLHSDFRQRLLAAFKFPLRTVSLPNGGTDRCPIALTALIRSVVFLLFGVETGSFTPRVLAGCP